MKRIEELWDYDHIPPFYGSAIQLGELAEVVGKCIENCNNTSNIREIVLEVWITLDFAIRQLILSGLDLDKYSDQELDIRYLLLPNSFMELVNILRKARQYCSKYMKQKKEGEKTKKVDTIGGFKSSYEFWTYIKEKDPELDRRIISITEEYQSKMNPRLMQTDGVHTIQKAMLPFEPEKKPFEVFNEAWMEVLCGLDDGWFRGIDKLNTARNVASHNYDAAKIAHCFGKTEPDLGGKVRSECFSLLKQLLNVKL
ncbi:hypothetical protein ACFLU4_08140 [Chloroflexota bacterium]